MTQKRTSPKNKAYTEKGRGDQRIQAEHNLAEKALRDAESTHEEIQRHSHLGNWDWNLATGKIYFSDEMFRLVGLVPGGMEMNRAIFLKFLHPDESERVLEEFQKSTAHPYSNIEHRIVLPNGEIRNVQTRVEAYSDEHGNPLRLLGSTRDITEQRRMEGELLENEKHFHSLFDNSTIGMYRTTPDGRILLTNPAGINLLGYDSFEEIAKRNLEDEGFESSHDRSRFQEILKRDGFVVGWESAWKRKDGSTIYVRESATAVKDDDGNILYYDGTFEDITERKEAEEARRIGEAKYQKIFESAPVGIFQSTPQGQFLKVNPFMARIFGYDSPQEMIEGITDISRQIYVDASDRQEFQSAMAEHGEVVDYICKNYHKDGTMIWTQTTARAEKDEHGNTLYYEGFISDITEHKQSEENLQKMMFLLEEAQHQSRLGSWEYDLATKKITWSKEVYSIFGLDETYTPSLGGLAEWIHPEDLWVIAPETIEKNTRNGIQEMEYRIIDQTTGEIKYVIGRGRTITDSEGKPLKNVGSFLDITERKRAESQREAVLEELRESEKRYHSLFNNMDEGVAINEIVLDENSDAVDYIILDVNPAFEKHSPYSSREAVGSRATDLYKMSPEFIRDWWRRHSQLKYAARAEYYHEPANHWFDVVTTLPENGRFATFFTNITERKRAEHALKDSEWRHRIVSELTADSIFIADVDSNGTIKIRWVSGGIFHIIGKSIEEIGTSDLWESIIYPDDRRSFFDFMSKTLSTAEVGEMECRVFHKQGVAKWVQIFVKPQVNEGSQIRSIVGGIKDITERKRAEMERQVLLEIMQGMISTNDLREFLELTRLCINKVIPAENYSVVLYDKEMNHFEEVYALDKYDPPMLPSKLEKSLTAYVFRSVGPLLLNQESFDKMAAKGEVELVGTDSACWLGVPLQTPNEILGVIAIQDYENPNRYTEKDKDFLTFIGKQIGLAIERKHAQEKLSVMTESLRVANVGLKNALEREQRVSRTDSLTDAHNRRFFFEIATHEFAVAKRYGEPLSMIMFDIDHFKGFNDRYGHRAGDEILKRTVKTAQGQLRDADILARYGGEEFAILLPNSTAPDSTIVAERIRESIAAYQMDVDGSRMSVTISVGVAELLTSTETLDQLVQHADRAMYAAKDAGRNCVVIYSE